MSVSPLCLKDSPIRFDTRHHPSLSPLTGVSYNQPRLDANATWNPNATTVIRMNATVGVWTPGVFVNSNNTVYLADQTHQVIHVLPEGNSGPTRNISAPDIYRFSIFVTTEDDVYMYGSNQSLNPIYKWMNNSTTSVTVMSSAPSCFALFIDTNSTLYCSISASHQVSKGSLMNGSPSLSVTAGTGSPSSGLMDLSSPRGIFVNTNFSLYVADSGNHRIQCFMSDQSSGITVAGSSASGTITLSSPFAVVLDGDGYLFIADANSNRIVGSGPHGFRCVAGCSRMNGSAPDQLGTPYMLSFDGYGNIHVTDTANRRVQKFWIQSSTHGKCKNDHWN